MNTPSGHAAVECEVASPATAVALENLSSEQRERLHRHWVDRASGELTTAVSFQIVLADLSSAGVPSELLQMVHTAIEDEHRHVDGCLRWARLLDPATNAQAELEGTEPASFSGASARDDRLLRTVFGSCFSETVAVHVLRASHARISLPSVRRLNQRHLSDEVGHARVGWALLGWSGLTARDRCMIRAFVPEMTRLTRMVWQSTPRPADERLEGLGYLSSRIVDAACDDALESVILPGLEHLGVR
jgi:hypothetical protein